jgi:hypothetical protein
MDFLRRISRAFLPVAAFSLAVTLGGVLRPEPLGSLEPDPETARAELRNRLEAVAPALPVHTLELALRAWTRAVNDGLTRSSVLTVIDYSLPSTEKRLWVLDVAKGSVLFHELVAHGSGTGENLARKFSNRPGSYQSSFGTFLTGPTYRGKHGLSLRLKGLEPGINHLAEARAIVVHGAKYVSESIVQAMGRLGRSQGCPAVREEISGEIIRTIKGGTVVFGYYPDPGWETTSPFLKAG